MPSFPKVYETSDELTENEVRSGEKGEGAQGEASEKALKK